MHKSLQEDRPFLISKRWLFCFYLFLSRFFFFFFTLFIRYLSWKITIFIYMMQIVHEQLHKYKMTQALSWAQVPLLLSRLESGLC